MNKYISLRGFMAWNYDDGEAWLDRMSQKGWKHTGGGCFCHRFEKDGQVYRNRIDYNPRVLKSAEETDRYKEMFAQQGWEFVSSTFNGWIFLRKPYTGKEPLEEYEIYTDQTSLNELVSRWMRLCSVLTAALIAALAVYAAVTIPGNNFSVVVPIFYLLLLAWMAYGRYTMKRKFSDNNKKKERR